MAKAKSAKKSAVKSNSKSKTATKSKPVSKLKSKMKSKTAAKKSTPHKAASKPAPKASASSASKSGKKSAVLSKALKITSKSGPQKGVKATALKSAPKASSAKTAKPAKSTLDSMKAKVGKAVSAVAAAVKVGSAKKPKSLSPKRAADLSDIVTPLDDRVIIRIEAGERVTSGGLIIPDTAAITGNIKGQVVAVGRGHVNKKGHLLSTELKVGDRILVGQHAGAKIILQDEELTILREQDVLGVLEA